MSDTTNTRRDRTVAKVFAALLVLVGVAYLYGGVQLALLGGSKYYLLTGLAIAAAGILLWGGNAWGAWLYAAMLAWTFVWAIGEVGVDFWTLLPRLSFPFLFGLFLLMPWVRRGLTTGPRNVRLGRAVTGGFMLAVVGLFGWGFVVGDIHEIKASGALPNRLSEYSSRQPEGEWLYYGNDQGGTRFSPLTQITPENVAGLEVAWTYRTGDYPPASGPNRRFQATPLKIGDTLYFCSPSNVVIALNAETGKERWRFDAKSVATDPGAVACRGVAYYEVPEAEGATGTTGPALNTAGGALCARRIIAPMPDARLLAVDADTGEICAGFGANGYVDLLAGLGEVLPGYTHVSSAPQIVRGKIVLGGYVADGQSLNEPSGVIRAFDAVTGAFVWAFDIGDIDNHDMPTEGEEFTRGTPNSWAPISADEELGLVYLPTGNATPDFWGGHRRDFDNRFSSSVLALNAETGSLVWSFQTTRYDLWDMDVSSQPSLVDLKLNGEIVPALVQLTKRGQNFVLDRRTGKPIYEVRELPVPQGGVEDPDRLSKTQPFSVAMPAFDGLDPSKPLGLDERDMWGITPFDQMWCRIQFRQTRWEGTLTPPGEAPVLFFPGVLGGNNWGSGSFDPERKILVSNWNRMPMRVHLLPRSEADAMGLHAADGKPGTAVGGAWPQMGTPYAAMTLPFLSPLGAPCLAPPYALVTAVDLSTGRVLWERRSGTARDSGVTIAGLRINGTLPIPMGIPGLGGSITTKGGLVFVAASGEQSLRAMDLASGDVL